VFKTEQTAGGQNPRLKQIPLDVIWLAQKGVVVTMIQQYDIFRLQDDGTPVWLEPATTLDDAQNRVHQFGVSEPGEYLIFNQNNAQKIPMRVSSEQGRD
jgi:hypothetical protein